MQYLQGLLITGGVFVVLLLSHGLYGLLVEVPVEELVVEEHARKVRYPGVIHPVRGAIDGFYPAVGEHQGELRQVEGPIAEDRLADPTVEQLYLVALERVVAEARKPDPAGECLDAVALEHVVAQARKLFDAYPADIGGVVESVALLQGLVREVGHPTAREGLLGKHVKHLRNYRRVRPLV